MNTLFSLIKSILDYVLIVTLATVLSACGSDGGQQDGQNQTTSNTTTTSGANNTLDSRIDKTEMLADLGAFFKARTLSKEDQAQIKAAAFREASQAGRLPNYIAGETLASPAVVASAGIKTQAGSTVIAQANFIYSTPVYRFYNLLTNVHFYTANEAERANVVATAPHFREEGTAFFASNNALEPNTAPVYRFFNYSTGAHFYTISQSERDTVINNFSQYYRFEGVAWYANPNPDASLTPMYRFYNFNVGAHFYTTSSSERAYVLANFPFMRDEGIAYYVAASRSYTIGGTASGLGSGKTVVLTLNGGADLSVSSNSSFTFGVALTSAQTFTIAIKTQPVAQSCSLTNSSGTVTNANIANITVTCSNLNTFTVGGTLTGLSMGPSVVLSLNGGNDLTLSANGAFTFGTSIPVGQTYAVVIKSQPIGQTCSVTNGSGTIIANTTNVGINCTINAPALVISEVASCPSGACWFEVFNPTTSVLNLSNYNLQSSSKNSGGTSTVHTFAMPSLSIAPNAYAIVMGNPGNAILPLNPQTALAYDGGFYPSWTANGFIEMISVDTGATVDFVKFGTNTQTPTTSTHWVGAQVAALSSSIYGNAIVRSASTIGTQDSNSATDWISVSFATPGGQNDVPASAVDSDNDGIPDSSELPGSTYAGMDLYSMGARQGVRDIFIEVDHMNSSDPGIIPRAEALQKMVDAFAAKSIAVHFDAGTQFSATFSPTNFNLGQGNSTVTYEQCVDFDRTVCISNVSQLRSVYDWKLANFELRRKNIFHYMLFANSQLVGGGSGSSGRAEIIGNDSVITLGGWLLTTSPDPNKLINYQAGTIMHEFGHNLGLLHGGNDSVQNYKPNYYSVMNYLYQLQGLASSASSIGPFQRWARNYAAPGAPSLCAMLNSACGSPSQFIIDYSNGSSASLTENALSESANIGRGADVGVYADWNGDGVNNASTYALNINTTNPNTTLTDYNDWANLNLPFYRNSQGANGVGPNAMSNVQIRSFDPMSDDKQPVSDCTPNPLWLRLAIQAR